MTKPNWIVLLLASNLFLGVFTACVNINVNIPAGVVDQASDDYVNELYKAKEKKKDSPSPSPAAAPKAQLQEIFWIPLAHAEFRPVRTDSEKAEAIKKRQRERLDALHKQKEAGVLGESNDGLLVLKGTPKKGSDKAVKKLMDDENADREELYRELVSHNSLNKGHLIDIRKSFARSFQKYSPAHTWIQDAAGEWKQKP